MKNYDLLGGPLTKLEINGAYVNEKCDAVYLVIERVIKNPKPKDPKEIHYLTTHYGLGHIKITPEQFVKFFVDTANCVSWEDLIKQEKERRKEKWS